MEHSEYTAIHDVYRDRQFGLRLRDVLSHVVLLRRLSFERPQHLGRDEALLRGAFPHRLVRRVAADPNAHRPYHPHEPHSDPAKPSQFRHDDEHPWGDGRRGSAALLSGGVFAWPRT